MTEPRALVLAVVPTRGGSRGVLRKHIRVLGGHPLLAYTIAAGRASTRVTDLVVSTEDPEIADLARSYGADVIERPLLEATPNRDASVTSVARTFDAHPDRVKPLDGDRLRPYIGGDDLPTRRQDLPPAYLRNDAIYLAHRHTVIGGSVWGSPEIPYEMPPERSVNIDEPLDFLLAEAVVGAGPTEIDLLLNPQPDSH